MNFLQVFKIIVLIAAGLMILLRIFVALWAKSRIQSGRNLPVVPYGVVFGAGLEKSGLPTKVLSERMDVACELYESKVIQKIILSGDNRNIYYNEPEAMRLDALAKGIPASDLLVDLYGFRSFNTCVNVRKVIGTQPVIFITQAFHLPRVLWTAALLGMDATGVAAEHEVHRIDDVIWWHIREIPATARVLWDVLRKRVFL